MSKAERVFHGMGLLSTGNPGLNSGRLSFCCECGKTFSTEEALEAHRESQEFACAAIMEEKFMEKQERGERHLKCHYCSKLFKTEEARVIHEEKKHPIDPAKGRPLGYSY